MVCWGCCAGAELRQHVQAASAASRDVLSSHSAVLKERVSGGLTSLAGAAKAAKLQCSSGAF